MEQYIKDARAAESARRLKGFGLHLACYFVTMIVLVALNVVYTPDRTWFLLPLVGWGSALALHAAYAMGLFNFLFGDGPEEM